MTGEADPFVGRTIGGCRVIERLGRGAMAVVYKANQLKLDRVVALKVFNECPKSRSQEGPLGRVFREARSAARLVHPNVVQVYDVGVDTPSGARVSEGEGGGGSEGVAYIVMEYVKGETLYARLQREGRLPAAEALETVRQAALALVRAQDFGIVHRDVKPANIMLSHRGEVKLGDFGLAKPVDRGGAGTAGSDEGDLRSHLESALGTPYYMSPEQAEGAPHNRGRGADVRSDIYSLGATFYHLVTGRPPFTGESAAAIILAHATERLVPACEAERSVPRAVSDLIDRMMAKSPAERYPSARALLAAIATVKKALLHGRGARPKPPTETNLQVGLVSRRAYRRLAPDLVTGLRPVDGPEERLDAIRSQVREVSRKGFFIETDTPLPVGSVVRMTLRLAPRAPETHVVGVVRWTREPAPGGEGAGRLAGREGARGGGMGVQFLELDAEAAFAAGGESGGADPGAVLDELTRTPSHLAFLRLHAASQGDAVTVSEVARRLDATLGVARLVMRPFVERGLVREQGGVVQFLVPEDGELRKAIAGRLEGDPGLATPGSLPGGA